MMYFCYSINVDEPSFQFIHVIDAAIPHDAFREHLALIVSENPQYEFDDAQGWYELHELDLKSQEQTCATVFSIIDCRDDDLFEHVIFPVIKNPFI